MRNLRKYSLNNTKNKISFKNEVQSLIYRKR